MKPPIRQNRVIADLISQTCTRSTSIVVVSSVLLGTIVIDQVTKWAALTFLSTPPYKVEVTPFFDLSLGFNTGVSFGVFGDLFSNQQWPLIAVTIAIAMVLTVWAARTDRLLETVAIALMAGGAFGNIIDRIRQGAVTDFLDFHFIGWHWPTFNFADVFICVGAVSLVIASIVATAASGSKNTERDDAP
jgi:signal peptidase II